MFPRIGFSLGILATLLLVVACSTQAAPSPAPTAVPKPAAAAPASAPAAAPAAPAKQDFKNVTLTGISWGGLWTDGMQGIFGGAFEAKTNGKVKVGSGSSAGMVAQAIAEKNNPQVDFIGSDDAFVPELAANKAIQQVEFSKIPNAKGFFNRVQKEVDQFDGFYLPFFVQEVGLAYRADILKQKNIPEPTKWADLWNPALKGKVLLVAYNYNFGWAFMEAIAKVRLNDPKNINGAFEELKKLKESGQVGMVVDSMTTLEKALTDGEAWVAVSSNGRAWGLQDRGVDVKFVNPEDYKLGNSGGVVALRKTANWDALMAYFNEVVDPKNQAKFLELTPYGPTQKETREHLSAKLLLRFRTTESQVDEVNFPDWDYMRQFRPALTERFNREIAR